MGTMLVDYVEERRCICGRKLLFLDDEFCSETCANKAEEAMLDLGVCQGCGGYGKGGTMCVRSGQECGQYI